MIKANELRIGNWISLSVNQNIQHYGKVLSIGSEDQQFEQIYCECEESFEWAFKDNYFGIPLDETWLERAGFVWSGGGHYANDSNDMWIEDKAGLYRFARPILTKYSIKFVHQLQNWYFLLSDGDELTFKPAPAGSGE